MLNNLKTRHLIARLNWTSASADWMWKIIVGHVAVGFHCIMSRFTWSASVAVLRNRSCVHHRRVRKSSSHWNRMWSFSQFLPFRQSLWQRIIALKSHCTRIVTSLAKLCWPYGPWQRAACILSTTTTDHSCATTQHYWESSRCACAVVATSFRVVRVPQFVTWGEAVRWKEQGQLRLHTCPLSWRHNSWRMMRTTNKAHSKQKNEPLYFIGANKFYSNRQLIHKR